MDEYKGVKETQIKNWFVSFFSPLHYLLPLSLSSYLSPLFLSVNQSFINYSIIVVPEMENILNAHRVFSYDCQAGVKNKSK